jgi:hypothetical protein
MGIREEDIMPQKAQTEAQVNQQAMQNPDENQGMGIQAPQEEMMEQGPGMQNPQEEMMEIPPMAQYGMMVGDYNYAPNQMYRDGGSLTRYQKKGEVKSKTYTKNTLPADAVIRDRVTVDTKAGDFIKQEDGTYKKVTAATLGKIATADTRSLGIPVEEFKKQSPENAKLIADANAIIEKGLQAGTITKDNKNNIKITGTWNGDFRDRVILSRALNATNTKENKGTLRTDKYTIVSQGATGPYSKPNPNNPKNIKGTGSFVAGFTPDLYEQRFVFEQAKGIGMTDDEAFAEVERIQKDPKLKAQFRRQFATTLGVKDIPTNDDELLKDDFYKKNYSDVTKGIEGLVGESGYRPAIGDEQLAGFEHFDALGGKPEFQYENEALAENKAVDPNNPDVEDYFTNPFKRRPTPWKQDKLNQLNAAVDYFNIDKNLSWAPTYQPELMKPIYRDPTRELAAQSEQANISNNALAQFMGAQGLSARDSSIQGQGAKFAADTLNRYNVENVGDANRFAGNNAQIMNEAQRYNQGVAKQLYDQNTIANQQFKNAKTQGRHNLVDAQNTLTTNMWKTDALNQMFPQYAVDPSVGGRMHFTEGKKMKPTNYQDAMDYADQISNTNYTDKMKELLFKHYLSSGNSQSDAGVDINALYPQKKGGATNMAYVMGSNVFPFMFY